LLALPLLLLLLLHENLPTFPNPQAIMEPAGNKQHQAASYFTMTAQQLQERVQMGRAAGTTAWLGGLGGMPACLWMAG
jgi:hypothetical protein